MSRSGDRHQFANRNPEERSEGRAKSAGLTRLVPAALSGLIISGLLAFVPLVYAGDQPLESTVLSQGAKPDPHAGIGEIGALREYAQQIGLNRPQGAAGVGGGNPHPHIDNSDFTALREYARDVGLESAPAAQPNSTQAKSPHRRFDVADIAAMDGPPAKSQDKSQEEAPASNPHSGMAANHNDPELTALREYARDVGIESAPATERKSPHGRFNVSDIAAMDGHPGKLKGEVPTAQSHSDIADRHNDPDLNALRDYARQISEGQPAPSDKTSSQVAAADNALDAFRDMLRKNAQPTPSPHPVPDAAPRRRPAPAVARGDPGFVNAHRMGSQTCLYCHAPQAEAFSRTLMGKIAKTQPAKLDCENCHGPGSAHVQAVGCASCHGEGGVTKRPGIPSLVGQDPQYLVPAMKAYLSGQRKHDLMRLVLSGLPEAEIQNIASYYARQIPDRAQTPPIGDAAAGRAATGLCANCHGERGVSIAPMWPSLAGQDAQYLADAIHGYKVGSRSKVIACAGCHGEGGVSSKPGMPNLAGMEPEYLVPAMKAYASGDRKHTLMRVLVSGVDEGQLNSIAQFYARQAPARARTPIEGNAAAGKAAAALCVGCHGEAGGSVAAAFPGLAGQDAKYLTGAIKAYRDDARTKTVACAGCHGDRGISRTAGMPSLAGLAPQYLVAAMKSYGDGQRKHPVMKALLTDVGETELNTIAQYYAGQVPARAETPTVGDAAAGKPLAAACAGCHGAEGVSANPIWPSLAGQDARYLADALRGYKDGSRDNAVMKGFVASLNDQAINNIAAYYATLAPAQPGRAAAAPAPAQSAAAPAPVQPSAPQPAVAAASQTPTATVATIVARCSGCHGQNGVTATPGMPSLAGLAPQYLVDTLKAYAGGQRKNDLMKGMLAGISESDFNAIAQYYAGQAPARASTPAVGDAAAGRALAAACGGCHGPQGISENPIWPSLAGQDAKYLADAIKGYKDGSRDNAMMKGLVAGLNDQAINNIASYYATLAPGRAAAPAPAQPAAAPAPAQPASRAAAQTPASTVATIVARCSGCHGQNGVTATPGMPSLAGLAPQYLVAALKDYASGKRKNDMMKSMLAGISDSDFNEIAQYYARQAPARAATPAVGDAAAGRAPSAACGGCHGPQGISENPIWPSLAGQDAKYLADAIKGYKDGTRDNALMKSLVAALSDQAINNIASHYATLAPAQPAPAVPAQPAPPVAQIPTTNPAPAEARCALCHGEKGVSKTPGMPSLAGLSQQYLLGALKAYSSGQRTHQVMRSILVGVDDAEFDEISLYYSAQAPARTTTPAVGDAAAGRALAAACGGCHGAQGISDNPIWPSLAGQDARYIADSLRAYKDGTRNNAMMKGFATPLNNQAINNIASYYASLSPIPSAAQPARPAASPTPAQPPRPVASPTPAQPAAPVASPAPAQPAPSVASPAPAQPARPAAAPALTAHGAPALVRNNLLAGLDDRTVADIAAYFASLTPTRSKPSGGGGREPSVVRNGLVASLDEGTVRNVASYYASLPPEQPLSARNAAPRPEPVSVKFVRPDDGSGPGGIVTFRKNDLSRKSDQHNAICLGCHEKGDRTYWNASTHETRGVACTDCHTVMRPVSRKAALKTPVEMETCFQCHKDRRAQIFRSSHMPLREGKMTCSNCHNPHGSATEGMLKEASINDTCYKCHAEKRGPFLFEHAPVRQNCLSCHDPHGTSNDNLLKVSRPRLCAECHGFGHGSLTNGPKTVETFGRACQNCHTQIHGSNSPSGALLQR